MTKIYTNNGNTSESTSRQKRTKHHLYLDEEQAVIKKTKPSSVEPTTEIIPNQLRLIHKDHLIPKKPVRKTRSRTVIYHSTSSYGISDWMVNEAFNTNSPHFDLMKSIGQNILKMCEGDFSAENVIEKINMAFSLRQPKTFFHKTKKGYDYVIGGINSTFGTSLPSARTPIERTLDGIDELMQTRLKTADGSIIDDSRIIQFLFICHFTKQLGISLQAKLFNPGIVSINFQGLEKDAMITFNKELHRFSEDLFSALFYDLRDRLEITPNFFTQQILPQMQKIDALTSVNDPVDTGEPLNANFVRALEDFSRDLAAELDITTSGNSKKLLRVLGEKKALEESSSDASFEVNITNISQLSPRELEEEKTKQ